MHFFTTHLLKVENAFSRGMRKGSAHFYSYTNTRHFFTTHQLKSRLDRAENEERECSFLVID